MRSIFIIVALFAVTATAFGQISAQYTNFMFFRQVYNPAVAGSESYVDMTGLFRGQWVGISGAPLTGALSVHVPIVKISSGVGAVITNDVTGEQRVTSAMFNYAYGKNFKFGRLSAGLGIGLYQKSLNGALLRAPQGTYENGTVDHNDNYIPNTMTSGVAPEMNLGIYFNNDNAFAGFSVANLIQSPVHLQTATIGTSIADVRTLIVMGGYAFKLNKNLHLIPNVLVKTDLRTFQSDFNLLIQYKSNLYGGLTFRGSTTTSIDALGALIGFRVYKELSIGYSYDFSLSALNNAESGSHEVYVNYRFRMKDRSKPGKVIYNPRFL